MASAARNLISGNRAEGVRLEWSNGSVIQGNFIGADVAGTAKVGNNNAVALFNSAGCTIGGTAAGASNVISGSRTGWGLTITDSTDNLVQGNFIGSDLSGTINLGNFSGGIAVSLASVPTTNNTIGGTSAGAGNTIAFNATGNANPGQGVYVSLDPGNPVLGNSIFSNNGQGIRHSLSAAPTLSGATTTSVTGTQSGPANTTFRLEFFATPDTGGAFDNAQGKTFFGAKDVTTLADGVVNFTFSPTGGVPIGQFLTATATDATGTSEFSHTVTATVPEGTSADLGVTISGAPDPVTAGESLTYTINVTNIGPNAGQQVSLTVPVPAGTTFASFTPASGWNVTAPAVGGSGSVVATTASLASAGSPLTFTFVVTVNGASTDGSNISGSASVASGTTDDPDSANNSDETTTTVHVAAPAMADVGVTVSATPDPIAPGGLLTYTITVTNDGPDAASGVGMTNDVPAGTTLVSFTAPAGWAPSTPAAGGTGTLSATAGALDSHAQAAFTLVVRVDAAAADGSTIVDSASISTGPSIDHDSDNDNDTATTTVAAATTPPPAAADLVVTQSASPGTATVGQNDVTFTITVTNHGPDSASSAALTEALPAGATFISATSGLTPSNGKLTFPLGNLANGARQTFTIVVRPTAAGTLTASASVSATESDPSTANNTAVASAAAALPTPAVTTDGPRIVSVHRFGIHTMPTTVVLTFDGPLSAASQNVKNYRITGPGGARVAIRSAVYDATTRTVTLHSSRPMSIHHPYRLVISGTGPDGLRDGSSRLLDGQGTGQPGSDYATTLSWRNLTLPKWYQKAKPSTSTSH